MSTAYINFKTKLFFSEEGAGGGKQDPMAEGREQQKQISEQIDKIKEQIAQYKEGISSYKEHIKGLYKQREDYEKKKSDALVEKAETEAVIKHLEDQLDSEDISEADKVGIRNNLRQYKDRLKSINEGISQLSDAIKQCTDAIAEYKNKISQMNNQINDPSNGLLAHLRQYESQKVAIKARLKMIASQIAARKLAESQQARNEVRRKKADAVAQEQDTGNG